MDGRRGDHGLYNKFERVQACGLENGMGMFSCMLLVVREWAEMVGRALALSNYVFTMFKHAEAIPIVIFYNSLRTAGPLSVGVVQNIMGVG